MHLITFFWVMNPHQICLQVKYWNEPKQVMQKTTMFNKSSKYITFKSAVKHRQLSYGYPRGQTVHLAEATTQDKYFSV